MKANVYSNTLLIGTTELEVGDKSMGHVYGNFVPNDDYYKNIQKEAWAFWDAIKPYKRWDALRLNIQLENGYFLFAQGGITFSDIKELPDEPIQIDIAGIDFHVIEDYFLSEEPQPFVFDPWEDITIEQKIAFEDELNRELGIKDKSIFDFLNPKGDQHALTGFELSALCKNGRNDDVLFCIMKPNVAEKFAVVHLTWTMRKERAGYPHTQFFKEFNDFKEMRMIPDRDGWD